MAAKVSQKKIDARVSAIYHQRCSGIEVAIFDLGKIMAVGRAAVADGLDDGAVGDLMRAFVETIRKN